MGSRGATNGLGNLLIEGYSYDRGGYYGLVHGIL